MRFFERLFGAKKKDTGASEGQTTRVDQPAGTRKHVEMLPSKNMSGPRDVEGAVGSGAIQDDPIGTVPLDMSEPSSRRKRGAGPVQKKNYQIHPSVEQAARLLNAGRHEEALQILCKRTEDAPHDLVAWNLRGIESVAVGRLEEANVCYDRALAIAPNDMPTVQNKYKCLLDLQRYQECMPYAAAYLSTRPEHTGALNAMGTCLSELGHFSQALEYLRQAVAIDCSDVYGWINLGVTLARLDQHEEAIRCYDRALDIEPYRALVWYNKASSEEQLGHSADAVRTLQKFLTLASDDLSPYVEDAKDRLHKLGEHAQDTARPQNVSEAEFSIGRVLKSSIQPANYKIRNVKHGGFGVVYVVEDGDGQTVVLKSFQARFLSDREVRDRFSREAVTWTFFRSHPNVVQAMMLEKIESRPFLVLEFVPGGDLSHVLREGPLSAEQALSLGIQLCDAMSFIHSEYGVVHRDIKPSNCLLTPEGQLKVTDFGLSRAFDTIEGKGWPSGMPSNRIDSQHTTVCGTLSYMAPEQFTDPDSLTTQTDIYAFGVMLFEMMTGKKPDDGRLARQFVMARSRGFDIPVQVLAIIEQSVEPEICKRPRDFGVLADRLRQTYETVAGKPSPERLTIPSENPAQWNLRGLTLSMLGFQEEAIKCFDIGLAIAPKVCFYVNKGTTLSKLGRHEEALICYDKAMAIDSAAVEVWGNKAKALTFLGRYEEAIECYDCGLKLAPRNATLLHNKGRTLCEMGKCAEALDLIDAAIGTEEGDAKQWQTKAAILDRLGRHEEALRSLQLSAEMSPLDPDIWLALGNSMLERGKLKEAGEYLARAEELGQKDNRAM